MGHIHLLFRRSMHPYIKYAVYMYNGTIKVVLKKAGLEIVKGEITIGSLIKIIIIINK